MNYDKALALKFYLDENNISLLEFSQITGISLEDLEGIFLHSTVINQSMSIILSDFTDVKDPKFWSSSKGNY